MNVPTTFIIESVDKKVLSTNVLVVFLKNLFIFGRNNISINDDQIYLSLSYSPKRETVEKKLKQLPVKYMRVFADNEEEFRLLCTGLDKFKNICFHHEDEEDEATQITLPASQAKKRKIEILKNEVIVPANDEVKLLHAIPPKKKKLRLHQVVPQQEW